jgi:zinc protease
MMNTLFDPEETERERRVIIAEREARENGASWWLNEAVMAEAFRAHPYRHPVIGWKHSLQNMPASTPYRHYKQHYMPNNAVLVLAGAFQTDALMRQVERLFGDLPAGPTPAFSVSTEQAQHGTRRVVVHMPGSVQYVHLAYHTPHCRHADFAALTVLDAILSGAKPISFSGGNAFSRSTRLYQALVESRMTATVSSQYSPSHDPYLFKFKATVQNGCTPNEIENLLHQEITRIQHDGVRDAEVSMALKQIQAQFAYAQERIISQAWLIGMWEMLDSHTRVDTLLNELGDVTAADVRRVAQAYLTKENCTVGHFIPGEQEAALGDIR